MLDLCGQVAQDAVCGGAQCREDRADDVPAHPGGGQGHLAVPLGVEVFPQGRGAAVVLGDADPGGTGGGDPAVRRAPGGRAVVVRVERFGLDDAVEASGGGGADQDPGGEGLFAGAFQDAAAVAVEPGRAADQEFAFGVSEGAEVHADAGALAGEVAGAQRR